MPRTRRPHRHADRMDGSDLAPAATDWTAGPPALVLLQCGCSRLYRSPSPAKGDVITCGTCGRPTVVLLPVRRLDRHAPPMTRAELLATG